MTQIEKKRVFVLAPNGLKQSQSVRNQWHANPEHETPIDAMLEPGYWAHVSWQMTRGDVIYALAPDDSFHAAFVVLSAGKNFSKVVKIPGLCFDIGSQQVSGFVIPEPYAVKFRGEAQKWCVLRGKDLLKENMDSRLTGENWLRDHLSVVGTGKAA